MKIYTKTGDSGFTSLTGGYRVKKCDLAVEAYGTVDEANAMIGLGIAKINNDYNNEQLKKMITMLQTVQRDLFHVGNEISTPIGENIYWPLQERQINVLEQYIDQLEEEIPTLKQFILPGGSEVGAILHIARTIIRRAERTAVAYLSQLEIQDEKTNAIKYLNRCSDFLFVASRWINHVFKTEEHPFNPTV